MTPFVSGVLGFLPFGGGIGSGELLLLGIIAVLLFGKRLPEVGRSLGKGISEFKRASNDLRNTLEEEVRLDDQKQKTLPAPPQIAASPETIHSSAKDAIDAVSPPALTTGDTVARGEHGS